MNLSLRYLPALAFLFFGLLMVYGSITMQDSFSGSSQHRWVPLAMSIFVSILASGLILKQAFGFDSENVEQDIEPRTFFLLVLPAILLFAFYAQAQIWFGWSAATFVSGVLIFRLFYNNWLSSFSHSIFATLILYLLFFKLLKLYNPPGRLLDLPLPF